MFTGIITEVGEVVRVETEGEWLQLWVQGARTASQVDLGSSVAVSGVCLTVVALEDGVMKFTILPETLAKTRVGTWVPGTRVNLENALRMGDEIGGHSVYGHVDACGQVIARTPEGQSLRLTVELPEDLRRYRAPKGSIALDGVSLTIAEMGETTVEVALVQYTLDNTTLGALAVGDAIHVECDMMLKYFAQMMPR